MASAVATLAPKPNETLTKERFRWFVGMTHIRLQESAHPAGARPSQTLRMYRRQTDGLVDVSNTSPHLTQWNVTFVGTEVPPHSRYKVPMNV
jgi:hypothetical protein